MPSRSSSVLAALLMAVLGVSGGGKEGSGRPTGSARPARLRLRGGAEMTGARTHASTHGLSGCAHARTHACRSAD